MKQIQVRIDTRKLSPTVSNFNQNVLTIRVNPRVKADLMRLCPGRTLWRSTFWMELEDVIFEIVCAVNVSVSQDTLKLDGAHPLARLINELWRLNRSDEWKALSLGHASWDVPSQKEFKIEF